MDSDGSAPGAKEWKHQLTAPMRGLPAGAFGFKSAEPIVANEAAAD
jgi:hypothetical protein